MKPLSLDLRQRIVAAYENGEGSHEALSARFAVSKALVGKLVRQHRNLGTLEPQVHRRGRKPSISGEQEQSLRAHLVDHPDATLQERIDALQLDCAVNTVWKTLRRWGWRFKKSPRRLQNKIASMWLDGVPIGVNARPTSIPHNSSSSMKRACKPR